MSSHRRTRHRPGPLAFVVLGWLVISGGELLAHDPGLSSLDVSVTPNAISLSLSIAASDVVLIAPSGDPRPQLRALAREAIRLSIDGETLSPLADEVLIKDGAAYIHLSFEGRPEGRHYGSPSERNPSERSPSERSPSERSPSERSPFERSQSQSQSRRLVIASDVPRRVSRGHREMMIVRLDDRVIVETLLDAGSDPVAIDLDGLSPSAGRTARYFLELGVRHILSGYDHLLFLAGLILAARTVRDVLVALTAFTAAHSLSLALVVIGGIHAPASLVEPLIAASIVWVGLENLVRGGSRSRWPLVFGFGLIHGFGFAGALMELGLAQSASETVVGLLSFNMGVEAGQLAVAAFVVPFVWLTRRRPMWHVGVMVDVFHGDGDRGWLLVDRSPVVAKACYKVPTRYFSPVGDGTPPAGSMVTAIATGCGISGGVLNVSLKLPCASGVSKPALIGACAVTTHS